MHIEIAIGSGLLCSGMMRLIAHLKPSIPDSERIAIALSFGIGISLMFVGVS